MPGERRYLKPLLIFGIVSIFIVAVVHPGRYKSQKTACSKNLEQIGLAAQMYRNDHQAFPEDMQDLLGRDKVSYIWATTPSEGDALAACGSPHREGGPGGRNVFYTAGWVRFVWKAAIEEEFGGD